MKTIETIKCHCGECAECLKLENEQKQQEQLRKNLENAETIANENTPPLFRLTNINHPSFKRDGFDKLKGWQPTDEKPWLGLIGTTGTCKTRIAYLLARAELDRMAGLLADSLSELRDGWNPDRWMESTNPVFHSITGAQLCMQSAKLQTGEFSEKAEARKSLNRAINAKLLLIDDLGKGNMNSAASAAIFAILDHRYSEMLTTIWTSNSTPEQIAAPMAEDVSAPFAGRLNDHSRIIRFK
jgi:hypothetical protein